MDQNENTGFWIVTGAASGIGAAVVRAVRNSGADVLALDVDEVKGSALADETGARYRALDVGDLDQWQQLADYLNSESSRLGSPRNIHLNAGIQIAPPNEPLSEYQLEAATLERYRRMMSVNVDGVVFGLQTLCRFWRPAQQLL